VEREEIDRMARALGLSRRAFEERYVRRARGRLSLKEREGGDCVLLGEDRRCTVYKAKPRNCSTFPFWPRILASEEEWLETAKACEGIGQGDLYAREDVERIRDGDPTPLLERHARPPSPDPGETEALRAPSEETWRLALAALAEVYADLEKELPRWRFTCSASGRCCDFDAYGHRLYVTTLEAEHFFRSYPGPSGAGPGAGLESEGRANDDPRQCPAYGADRLCHAREGRMLGCRTYFCGPYPAGVPEELHERYLPRIKALHDRYGIPYRYMDVVAWAAERRPATGR
jgi:Fe-S-cluster containining protein